MTLSSRCVIASHASITGTHHITISPYCILNPYSRLVSVSAPVIIGEGCLVWEKGSVGIQDGSLDDVPEGAAVSEEALSQGVTLGKNVVIESMAVVEALEVGEGTVIETGARIGIGCIIGKVLSVKPLSWSNELM
jgi:dynactin 6